MHSIPFVDAHVHFWDLTHLRYPWLTPPFSDAGPNGSVEPIARDYLPGDYRRDTAHWNVVGAVHVDAGADPADALAETRWLEEQAEVSSMPTGIVAFAALEDPGVERLLAAHADNPRVRGIRQIVNWHEDPRRTYTTHDITLDPAWERGFGLLAKYNLSFDLQCYPDQMPALAGVIGRHDNVSVMINHMGMPVISDEMGADRWRGGMRSLARYPQVSVKISGPGFIWRHWTGPDISQFVLRSIELFGTDRAMFATDLPTDKLFGSVDHHLEAYHAIVASFSDDERRALFGRNANNLYRLNLSI